MTTYVWKGEPDDESRQHYTNVRIQEFQRRFGGDLDFRQVLFAFRAYGQMYDQGFRLRHLEKDAA